MEDENNELEIKRDRLLLEKEVRKLELQNKTLKATDNTLKATGSVFNFISKVWLKVVIGLIFLYVGSMVIIGLATDWKF